MRAQLDGERLQSGQQGAGSGPPSGLRERQIYDVRDYKVADLEKHVSIAGFKEWKHDFERFVETIGASWSGVTSLLRHCRLYEDGEFDAGAMEKVAKFAEKVEGRMPPINSFLFKFEEKAEAIYKLVMPRLPVDLATEF